MSDESLGSPFFIAFFITSIFLVFIGKSSKIEAVAFLTGPANSKNNNIIPSGNVTFTQNACGENVHVRVYLTGIVPGKHGFHVHEKGDLTNGCTSMGAHYNPEKLNHGGRTDEIRHVGDLGNLEANELGIVDTTFTDHLISLTGPRTIIGRGLVVHETIDDLGKGNHPDSKKTGNSGGRVACGVIGVNIVSAEWPCMVHSSGSSNKIILTLKILLSFLVFVLLKL
uniref:Superoxide dismutase [Cu-Zn] n=1 Tax=Glossina brevipalpis TaxID=37001 RepID=A0A1A9WP47_9MUSC